MDASAVQTTLSVGVPTLAVLVGILINNSRLGDFRGHLDAQFRQIDARFSHIDTRFNDMKDLFDAKLSRVEEVLDARLTRIEQELKLR